MIFLNLKLRKHHYFGIFTLSKLYDIYFKKIQYLKKNLKTKSVNRIPLLPSEVILGQSEDCELRYLQNVAIVFIIWYCLVIGILPYILQFITSYSTRIRAM